MSFRGLNRTIRLALGRQKVRLQRARTAERRVIGISFQTVCLSNTRETSKTRRRRVKDFFAAFLRFPYRNVIALHRHNLPHVIHLTTMSAFTVTSAIAARVAAPKAARAARRSTIVRAAEEPVTEAAMRSVATQVEPVLRARQAQVRPPAPRFTLQQAFRRALSGPRVDSNFIASGPELMNGRLAMLGFVAAAGAEISTGETVAQQFADAPTAVRRHRSAQDRAQSRSSSVRSIVDLKVFTTNTVSSTRRIGDHVRCGSPAHTCSQAVRYSKVRRGTAQLNLGLRVQAAIMNGESTAETHGALVMHGVPSSASSAGGQAHRAPLSDRLSS